MTSEPLPIDKNSGALDPAFVASPSSPAVSTEGFNRGEGPSRIALFLDILSAMGGKADASDYPYNWINAFCEDHEGRAPDTLNQAIDGGYVDWSHDSDSDNSTVRLNTKGRAYIASPTPSPPITDGEV